MAAQKTIPSHLELKTAKALVTLREYHRMNLNGVNLVCNSMYDMLDFFIKELEATMSEHDGQHISDEVKDIVMQQARRIVMNDPLKNVNTEYKVMKFIRTHCGLIDPVEITLGSKMMVRHASENATMHDLDVKASIVPFIHQLRQILSNKEVFDMCITNPIQPSLNDNVIRNIKDGDIYKNNEVCRKYPDCLLIQIYLDDIELVNALGSHTKTHKITAIYWSLLNLPEEFRSNLKSINLLGFATANSVKDFGLEAMFEDAFCALEKLESSQGLELEIDGSLHRLHGTLISVVGDGLALNEVGGFKGISQALKPCRNCDISKSEIAHLHVETKLRDLQTHQERLKKLDEAISKAEKDELRKLYGIKGVSVFSALPSFDVTRGFVQDLMHNLLEGIEEVEIRALLFKMIEVEKLFTFDEFNYMISSFPYPIQFMGVKPSPIERHHVLNGKLRENASQMICLLYILPVIFEPFESKEQIAPNINNFSLLSKIGNILLAYEVNRDSLDLCRAMIVKHHSMYSKLYPQYPPTPKFHFVVHAPTVLEQYGPTRNSWTMRYEGLNAMVSKIGSETRNFKNIAKTLANRFQIRKCLDYEFGDKDAKVLGSQTFCPGDGQEIDLTTYLMGEAVEKEIFSSEENDDKVFEREKIIIKSFEIKLNSVLMIDNLPDAMPSFGQVKTIFTSDSKCAFVVKLYQTDLFNQISNTYEVRETNKFTAIAHRKLPFLHPLPIVKLRGKTHVILQYHSRTEYFGL